MTYVLRVVEIVYFLKTYVFFCKKIVRFWTGVLQGWKQWILALEVRKNGLGRQGGNLEEKNNLNPLTPFIFPPLSPHKLFPHLFFGPEKTVYSSDGMGKYGVQVYRARKIRIISL